MGRFNFKDLFLYFAPLLFMSGEVAQETHGEPFCSIFLIPRERISNFVAIEPCDIRPHVLHVPRRSWSTASNRLRPSVVVVTIDRPRAIPAFERVLCTYMYV